MGFLEFSSNDEDRRLTWILGAVMVLALLGVAWNHCIYGMDHARLARISESRQSKFSSEIREYLTKEGIRDSSAEEWKKHLAVKPFRPAIDDAHFMGFVKLAGQWLMTQVILLAIVWFFIWGFDLEASIGSLSRLARVLLFASAVMAGLVVGVDWLLGDLYRNGMMPWSATIHFFIGVPLVTQFLIYQTTGLSPQMNIPPGLVLLAENLVVGVMVLAD